MLLAVEAVPISVAVTATLPVPGTAAAAGRDNPGITGATGATGVSGAAGIRADAPLAALLLLVVVLVVLSTLLRLPANHEVLVGSEVRGVPEG